MPRCTKGLFPLLIQHLLQCLEFRGIQEVLSPTEELPRDFARGFFTSQLSVYCACVIPSVVPVW